MMDKRLNALRLLSNTSGTWKIGMDDAFISKISNKISMLPSDVYHEFCINHNPDKKISTIDFALMTYDMPEADRLSLMKSFNISPSTIDAILHTADDIVNIIEKEKEKIER